MFKNFQSVGNILNKSEGHAHSLPKIKVEIKPEINRQSGVAVKQALYQTVVVGKRQGRIMA